MPNGTIDSLNLQITAEARSAEKSIDSLASTLTKLNRSLTGNISGLKNFSKELGNISTAIKKLSGINFKVPNTTGLTKMFESFNKIDTGNAQKTADNIKKVFDSVSSLGNINFNDTGINKTVNALNRLFKTDFGKFNPQDFEKISDAISKLGNVKDVSPNVNRLVSSLAKIASAGEKTKQSSDSIYQLSEEIKKAVSNLSGIGTISSDVTNFLQSIAKLASAGNKTGQTASGLKKLADETLEFFRAMQNAPKISSNTLKMTQALAQLAASGSRVSISTSKVSTAFNKLSSISSKVGSVVGYASQKIVSAFNNIGNSSKGLDSAGISLMNILKGIILYRGINALTSFGKSAIELGKNITEVENVVDVSFGNMADQAYDFASTATEQFGLSELAAKQYSGTMMAMLKSSGVAQDAAAEMSTTLAGLAGDLASFYNTETDEAFYKLRAAMAGEIEPLRQLGINMTVANLEAYAMANGINKAWQEMTQAEQAMLRYNYILSVTGDQQGDYQRTIGSFANQTRLLALNFQSLSAVIGQGVIAAILPAIQGLNAFMSVLYKAAVAFRTFMYTITGYEPQGSQSGIVNDLTGIGDVSTGLEDIGTSGDDAADGMDDAADSAKDLDKALSTMNFDQLHQLSSNASDVSDSLEDAAGSAGGLDDINTSGSGISGILGDNLLDTYPISAWAERIRKAFLAEDWDQLGFEIADGINSGLQKIYDVINWKNVGPKITAFTSAFTQTFNSLADNIDFDLLGRTIGAGFNTVIYTLNQLMDGIDWINLGSKLGQGFMGLVNEVDWFEFGRLIGNHFMIFWDTLLGLVNNLDWSEIGISLGNGFNGVFREINLGTVGTAIGKTVAGIIDMIRNFFKTANWSLVSKEVETGIKNALSAASNGGENNGILYSIFGVAAIAGIVKILSPISGVLSSISGIIASMNFEGLIAAISAVGAPAAILVAALAAIAGGLIIVFEKNEDVRKGFYEAAKAITNNLEPAISFLKDEVLPDLNNGWKKFKDIIRPLTDFLESTFTSAWEDLINPALSYLGEEILPTVIDTAKNLWKNVFVPLANFVGSVFTPAFKFASEILTILWKNVAVPLAQFIGGIFSSNFQAITKILNNLVIPAVKEVISVFQFLWNNVFSPIVNFLGTVFKPIFESVFKSIGNLISNLQGVFQGLINFITGIFSRDWKQAWNGIVQAFSSIFSGIGTIIKAPINAALGLAKGLVNGIVGGVNWILKKVGSSKRLSEWDGIYLKNGSSGLKRDTLGIVNDQKGSTYKELIVPPKGKPFIPEGRNVMLPLQKGTKIMPADETKEFMKGFSKIPKFKGGIGDFFGSAWSAIKNFTGEVWDYLTHPQDLVKIAIDKFTSISGFVEPWMSVAGGMVNTVLSGIIDFVSKIFESTSPVVKYNPSAGVEQWRTLAAQALRMEGQYSPSNLNLMLYQMQTESSGNPNAINKWDINAKRGTPSKGLMQVIDPTFRAYARPGYNTNIWDPLSNMLAAIRYTVRRYGSLSRGWKGHGYAEGIGTITMSDLMGRIPFLASGGLITAPTLAFTGENYRKEAVLPLENRRSMRMVADSIVDNSDGFGVSSEEIRDAVAEGVAFAMMNNQGNISTPTLYVEVKTESDEVLARAVTRGQKKIDYRENPSPAY